MQGAYGTVLKAVPEVKPIDMGLSQGRWTTASLSDVPHRDEIQDGKKGVPRWFPRWRHPTWRRLCSPLLALGGKDILDDRNNRVCPVERAGILDTRIRRWLQDPQKILSPILKKGWRSSISVVARAFFLLTRPRCGRSGRVIASDCRKGCFRNSETRFRNRTWGTDHTPSVRREQSRRVRECDFVLASYVFTKYEPQGVS